MGRIFRFDKDVEYRSDWCIAVSFLFQTIDEMRESYI